MTNQSATNLEKAQKLCSSKNSAPVFEGMKEEAKANRSSDNSDLEVKKKVPKVASIKKVLRKKLKGKQPILFIGSGISKAFIPGYPDWTTLLKELINNKKRSLTKDDDEDTLILLDHVRLLVAKKQFEEAAQELSYIYYPNRNSYKEDPMHSHELKCEVSKITGDVDLVQMQTKMNADEKSAYLSFRDMNPKIIITTNFDNFIEKTFDIPPENILYSQVEMIANHPTNPDYPILYKIHGSSTPRSADQAETAFDSIIFTKEDYDRFFRQDKYIYSKLLTLFIEHPVVFLGYSVSDRNINNIVSTINEIIDEKNRDKMEDWFFVSFGRRPDEAVCSTHKIGENQEIDITCFNLKKEEYNNLYQVLSDNYNEKSYTYSLNPSLINLLLEPLYSGQNMGTVVLRELYQNAKDACLMYNQEYTEMHHTITILVSDNNGSIYLTVKDSGIGMSPSELKEYFLSIGNSSKRDHKNCTAGHFGIGFLSCFAIADEIFVATKRKESGFSYIEISKNDAESGAKSISIHNASMPPVNKLLLEHGTCITLRLKQEGKEYYDNLQTIANCFMENHIVKCYKNIDVRYIYENKPFVYKYDTNMDSYEKIDSPGDISVRINTKAVKSKVCVNGMAYTDIDIDSKSNTNRFQSLKEILSYCDIEIYIETSHEADYVSVSLDRFSVILKEKLCEIICEKIYSHDIETFFIPEKSRKAYLSSLPDIYYKKKRMFQEVGNKSPILEYHTMQPDPKRIRTELDFDLSKPDDEMDLSFVDKPYCLCTDSSFFSLKDDEDRLCDDLLAISYCSLYTTFCTQGVDRPLESLISLENSYKFFTRISDHIPKINFHECETEFYQNSCNIMREYSHKLLSYRDVLQDYILVFDEAKNIPKIDGIKVPFYLLRMDNMVPRIDSTYALLLQKYLEDNMLTDQYGILFAEKV